VNDWYVIATNQQDGALVCLRIVAGPLSMEAATQEAQLRLRRTPKDFKLAVVQFDPFFGLTETG
jgi:hypothetical protein